MDLALNKEQEMVRALAREFAEKSVAPIAAELDMTARTPMENIRRMGDLGFLGITVPVEYGGAGLDTICCGLVIEEIAQACAATAATILTHDSLVNTSLMRFGSDMQKQKYLIPLAKGRKIGSFALTEYSAGSDVGAIRATAVRRDGHYLINGTKHFISNGSFAEVLLVFAKTDSDVGTKGISCFIVEKGQPGFSTGKPEDKMGIRGSNTCELVFEDVYVPVENRLGNEGEGFKIAMTALDIGRIGVAAQAVGISQAALDAAIAYAKMRKQFGQPIANFQYIQFTLADMATRIEAARLLVWSAALKRDGGQRYSKEAAMAKLFASETAGYVTSKAVQIHGGYGYMKEYSVERYFRDAKITEIYEGTSEVQRMVISSGLLR